MKHFLLLVFGAFLALPVFSQNYQAVNSSEVKLLEPQFGTIRGYRIDSVLVAGADSLLYPSRAVRETGESWECYQPSGASMLGDHIRILPDGDHLFFNQNSDTIRIKTQATLYQEWVMWSDQTTTIHGKIVQVDAGNVFGVTDSIKSIRISAPDYNFDGDTLLLSKQYGLLNTYNFYAFPDMNESYYEMPLKLYNVYGILSKNLGGSNLTMFDVFDFQPGDEIQYEKTNLNFGSGTILQIAEHYTSRQDYYPDSIVYGLDRSVLVRQLTPDTDSIVSLTTVATTRTILPNPYFDALPTLPVADQHWVDGEALAYYSMEDGDYLQKQDLSSFGGGNATLVKNPDNDCYQPAIDGACPGTPHTYLKGLGGPYYYCSQGAPYIKRSELTYFLKDTLEWGSPFDFSVSVAEAERDTGFRLYPNPASDEVRIQTMLPAANMNIDIFDLSGRRVLHNSLPSGKTVLDISKLPPGVYSVRVTLSGKVFAQKLIVE